MPIKLKRIFAGLIDLGIIIAIFFVLLQIFNLTIIQNFTDYPRWQEQLNQVFLDSGLYIEKDGQMVLISENIDEKLTEFYTLNQYYDPDAKALNYEDAKARSGLFELDENGKYHQKSTASSEALSDFYESELYKARFSLASREDYKDLQSKMKNVMTIGAYAALLISSLIEYFVIPLCLKNGQSLGKKIWRLEVKSEPSQKLTILQLFMRFLGFFAIELLPSLYFYGATFIISSLLALCTKEGKMIHDYFALTIVKEKEFSYEEKNR